MGQVVAGLAGGGMGRGYGQTEVTGFAVTAAVAGHRPHRRAVQDAYGGEGAGAARVPVPVPP
ncbi:hypothetical protein ABTZ93_05560 [Streptomyces sp. NPDC097941]|uniref:hypothetical protein n=1 Tax=Streptomyces sp. NPDC097941 TaxID=3155685 RepID=UPI003321BA6E